MSDQEQNASEALTLTIPETARLLGISLSKTYEAARLGQIPTIRLGTRVLVSRRRLEEFVDGQTSSAGDALRPSHAVSAGRKRRGPNEQRHRSLPPLN